MRDHILKGQCAICKTVINGHASPIIPNYLCLDCDTFNWVTGSNLKKVIALEYPTGILEDVAPPGIHDPYVFATQKWKDGSVIPGKKE